MAKSEELNERELDSVNGGLLTNRHIPRKYLVTVESYTENEDGSKVTKYSDGSEHYQNGGVDIWSKTF